ncbi:MAG: DUF1622 domain-containing protein [Elusimicrobiota bacterium]
MTEILKETAFIIGIIASATIIYGVALTLKKMIELEFKRFKGKNICQKRDEERHHLGSYILLGLEFFIAADIIRTAMDPALKELAILGSIVVIRTVLSIFLNQELKEKHNCEV